MPRQGELTYFEAIGEVGRQHALNKPFSEEACGVNLMQVGAVLALLPLPPARVLDCGCGTGWLTYFLHKRGYETVGTDVSAQAISLAEANPLFHETERPSFLVRDSEQLSFEAEFDAVLFFDSLHHAVDEQAAVSSAYRALKPGGVCITSEPGRGHEARSREAITAYDVTEKDMTPGKIVKLGRAAGFRRFRLYPRADHIGRLLYHTRWPALKGLSTLLRIWPFKYLAVLTLMMFVKRHYGITVMEK